MPKGHKRVGCWSCGRSRAEVGSLSATGLCQDCGEERAKENFLAMKLHNGPAFEHWKRRTLAAFGIVLQESDPSAR
jgi:hypothetical protein